MKTRGFGVKVVTFVGVIGLVSSLLLLGALRSRERRSEQTRARRSPATAGRAAQLARPTQRTEVYGKLSMSFEENQGQTAREVKYVSHGDGYDLFLTPQEAVLSLRSFRPLDLSPLHRMAYFRAVREASRTRQMTAIRMYLEGANPGAKIAGTDQLPGKANYFIGNDPKKWHTDVPTYARVKYAEIYPGVDLIFYGNQRQLEYDFIVAPGANPNSIRLKLQGAQKLRVNANGDLILNVAEGEVILQKPVVYQIVKSERHEIRGSYALTKGHQVMFSVPDYDRSEPLVLDPVLNYSTYLGGSADDSGTGIAVDSSGNAFVVGNTTSTNFPGASASISAANANGAVFVAKINPAGTQLLYSSYLAGTGIADFGLGIALDPTGNVYVTGETFSTDFPTTASNALKSGTNLGATAGTSFISKINPAVTGPTSLVYSSYLGGTGGSSPDFGNSVAVDANGNAYVTGFTAALPGSALANFPITSANAFQTSLGSANGNAFLTKIDTTKLLGASLIYSTYLGGSGVNAVSSGLGFGEEGFGVAVDSASSANAYLVGATTSADFPMTTGKNGFQITAPAAVAKGTAFVSRIDTTKSGGASLIYSTYLGGNTFDFGTAITLQPGGTSTVAYAAGISDSTAFPTFPSGAFQLCAASGSAFISLIDTGLSGSTSLKYSTCLGLGGTSISSIQADAAGNAYVGGGTNSSAFPVTPEAFQPAFAAGAKSEGFLSKLSPGGNGTADLVYSTFFGGSGSASGPDSVSGVAIDASSPPNVFITGQTFSAATFPVFPPGPATIPAFQATLKGPSDAFIAKLSLIPTLIVAPTSLDFGAVLIGTTTPPTQTVTLTNNTNAAIAFISTVMGGSPAAANTDYTVSNSCSGSIPFGTANTCTLTVTFKPTVVGAETATLRLTDSDSSSPQNIALTGSGTNTPPDFTVTAPATATVTDGSQVQFTVTVTPVGNFTSQVDLACVSAPTLTLGTCTPSPASVTTTDGVTPKTSTVTVATTAFMVPPSLRTPPPNSIRQIVPLFLALMLLFLLPRTRQLRMRLALATAMIFFAVLAGCNGTPHAHTQKGPYALTITGTLHGGTTAHSATVNLTVN